MFVRRHWKLGRAAKSGQGSSLIARGGVTGKRVLGPEGRKRDRPGCAVSEPSRSLP